MSGARYLLPAEFVAARGAAGKTARIAARRRLRGRSAATENLLEQTAERAFD